MCRGFSDGVPKRVGARMLPVLKSGAHLNFCSLAAWMKSKAQSNRNIISGLQSGWNESENHVSKGQGDRRRQREGRRRGRERVAQQAYNAVES